MGLKKKELAEKLNILPQHVNKYLTGELDPLNLVDQLMLMDINIQWLLTGEGPQYTGKLAARLTQMAEGVKNSPLLSGEQNIITPKYGHWYKVVNSIDAGDPLQIYREENYTGEEVYFPFGNTETCFPLKVVGDSMTCSTDDSIPNGEYVLADLSETPLPGDIVVISLTGGRQMIKQYIDGPEDNITLRSFNPNYPDIIIKKTDVIKMIRVIGQGHFKRR
ncbi:MAG TPA: S24 family peptidase [Ignavibacteriales bacterium]|nr:S24 family peptidase [Ignavibacteriales bacterium]